MLAGLYWALLSTPESNAVMLALSLVLVVVLLLGPASPSTSRCASGLAAGSPCAGTTSSCQRCGCCRRWRCSAWCGGRRTPRARRSRRRAGAITAAIIARTGWANPEALFTAARWLATLVAWVVGPLAALGLFGALTRGVPVGAVRRWLRPALSWRALAVGALVVIALAWFWPLLEAWRPALPPTWVQLVFVAAKIAAGLTALALAIGSFIRLAALDPGPPDPPREPADQRQAA